MANTDLSRRALAYASALDGLSCAELASRLYCYNRIPASGRWRHALPRPDSAADFLGFRPHLPLAAADRVWTTAGSGGAHDGWFAWHRRGASSSSLARCEKLYVGIGPEAMPAFFPRIIEALALTECISFKVGADVYGILRPDKLVAYFSDHRDLALGALIVNDAVQGAPVHAVPFTPVLDDVGRLSWGIDPPPTDVGARQSWRSWVTTRLAAALQAAPSGSTPEFRAAHALEQLERQSVDVVRWVPRANLPASTKGN